MSDALLESNLHETNLVRHLRIFVRLNKYKLPLISAPHFSRSNHAFLKQRKGKSFAPNITCSFSHGTLNRTMDISK